MRAEAEGGKDARDQTPMRVASMRIVRAALVRIRAVRAVLVHAMAAWMCVGLWVL